MATISIVCSETFGGFRGVNFAICGDETFSVWFTSSFWTYGVVGIRLFSGTNVEATICQNGDIAFVENK